MLATGLYYFSYPPDRNADRMKAFSDNGTHLRGEKHEDGGGFGLLVQDADLLHLERGRKWPRAAPSKPRLQRP